MLKNIRKKDTLSSWSLWKWISFLLLILAIFPAATAVRARERKELPATCAPYSLFNLQTSLDFQININKIVIDRHLRKEMEATTRERGKLKAALLYACSEHCIQEIVSAGSKLQITIVPEMVMQETVGLDEFDGAFLIRENMIYLNSYLLEAGREQQLLTVLSNEMSHAITKAAKRNILPKGSEETYQSVAPWNNNEQKTKLIAAHTQFLKRMEDYRKVLDKSLVTLTRLQRKDRQKYDKVMLNYITPRHGKDGYNANQLYFTVQDSKTAKKRFNQYKNIYNTPPLPTADRAVIIKYNAENFFREFANQDMSYSHSVASMEIYHNAGSEQYFADKISDFAMLPPEMQNAFGPELCQLLNEIYTIPDTCSRPWPPPPLGISNNF